MLDFILDVRCQSEEGFTNWIFKIHEEFSEEIKYRLLKELHHLGQIWRDHDNAFPCMIPAQGEWHEEFGVGWCYMAGFEELPMSLDISKLELTLTFANEPEGDDRLDYGHPHWRETPPHQWIAVMSALKDIFDD